MSSEADLVYELIENLGSMSFSGVLSLLFGMVNDKERVKTL